LTTLSKSLQVFTQLFTTFQLFTTLHNFKKKKPELGEKLDELYKKVRHVREMSGVHYPSDRKISEILFKKLLDANLI
jgi:hypothetical protein